MNTRTQPILKKIAAAGLAPPETLTLMITGACNLNCPHCLLDCKGLDAAPVPAQIITGIIDEFSRLGGTTLFLTGGEPLTHPHWFDILEYACTNTDLNLILQTNGIMVTRKVQHQIKSLASDALQIQVSLDGATPDTNDMIRGNGNFQAAMKGIGHLVDAGMGRQIIIAFTEMKHNFEQIPDMLKLAADLGAGRLTAGTLVKGGRAKNTGWLDLPDTSQVRRLIRLYVSDETFKRQYDRIGHISAIEWYKGRGHPADHVCNCITTPFISAAGRMYPCAMNLDDGFAVSKVHEQGLRQSILNGLDTWAALPELDARRRQSLVLCQDCAGKGHCKGGCMGRALAAHGTILSVEDRCRLRKEVYDTQI